MNKFTKGEWNYQKYSSGDYGIYSVDEEESPSDIALVRSRGEETFANVKLLTYAPEMLELLKSSLEELKLLAAEANYSSPRWWNEHISPIERLIYKITEE